MNNFSPEHFESTAKINLTSNIGVYFVLFGIVIQIFQFKTILLSSSILHPCLLSVMISRMGFAVRFQIFIYFQDRTIATLPV